MLRPHLEVAVRHAGTGSADHHLGSGNKPLLGGWVVEWVEDGALATRPRLCQQCYTDSALAPASFIRSVSKLFTSQHAIQPWANESMSSRHEYATLPYPRSFALQGESLVYAPACP